MTNQVTKVDAGHYVLGTYEIEYSPEIKAWNIYEAIIEPGAVGWCIGTDRDYVQTWNTLRECKSWISKAIAGTLSY